ncbi:MAG: autotransporter domain-containing protein, partial [Methylobacillus sp.]|nr:autotransporter domain-containing protein [Methylobacillus sp.]
PSLTYDANNVYLTLLLLNNTSFDSVGGTPNQIATGTGIPGSGAVYDAVIGLSAPQARAAFDLLSGEIHASAQTVLLQDSRFIRDAAFDRLRFSQGSAGSGDSLASSGSMLLAYAGDDLGSLTSPSSDPERGVMWARAFGSWGKFDGDGNAASLDRDTGGMLFGADGSLGGWRVGALAGYSQTDLDVSRRRSSADSDNYHIGLYAGTQWDRLALRTGVAYSWHDIESRRSVPLLNERLKGDTDADTTQVFAELGYGLTAGKVNLEPFANLAYVNLSTDGFTEKGGSAALRVKGEDQDMTFTTLGIHASAELNERTHLRGTLGWRHAFGNDTPETTMQFVNGTAFDIAGVPLDDDTAVIDAGLDFALTKEAALGVAYSGQLGSDVRDHGVRVTVGIRF